MWRGRFWLGWGQQSRSQFLQTVVLFDKKGSHHGQSLPSAAAQSGLRGTTPPTHNVFVFFKTGFSVALEPVMFQTSHAEAEP